MVNKCRDDKDFLEHLTDTFENTHGDTDPYGANPFDDKLEGKYTKGEDASDVGGDFDNWAERVCNWNRQLMVCAVKAKLDVTSA